MCISHVDTDSGTLAVEAEGLGPLVICLPGVGDTRDAFAPLAEYLVARGFRVARVDLRGHGDSTAHFGRCGDVATADDFLTVIEALGGGSAVLAGASFSAAAAVIAAGCRPEQVAGLVLLGYFLHSGTGKAMRRLLQAALVRPWGPSIWRPQAAKLWPGLGEKAGERAAIKAASLLRPAWCAAFRATSGTDHAVVAPWIGRVHAPVLVVMGDADPDWRDPLAEAAWVASNFTSADTVEVPCAGHAPMLERPEVVDPAVSRFLERIRADGAFRSGDA